MIDIEYTQEVEVMSNNIGTSIKKLRIKNNISQDFLAEKLYVSRQAISNWENGKSQPDIDTLSNLGNIFNVSIDEIITGNFSDQIKSKKNYIFIPLISLAISVLHLILSFKRLSSPIGVMISVLFASIVSIFMFFTFENSIKNKDFTIIAGHKKRDELNFNQYINQLRSISLLTSSFAVLLNIVYFLIYTDINSRYMFISIIFFLIFILGLLSIILIVNYKYKLKNKEGR